MNQYIPNLLRSIRENFQGQQHRPVSKELALQLTENVNPNDVVGLFDAGCVIALTLIERGHDPSKIYVIEKSLEKCYTEFSKSISKRFGFNVIQPPMGNINRIDMKFDVIIGNPPYTDTSSESRNSADLDTAFFERGMVMSDRVSLIIREKHMSSRSSSFRKRLFSSGNVQSIEYMNPSVFSINKEISVCIVTYDKSFSGKTEIRYGDGVVKYEKLTKDSVVFLLSSEKTFPENNLEHRWIRGKSTKNSLTAHEEGIPVVLAAGSEKFSWMKSNDVIPVGVNQHGVLMNVTNHVGTLGPVRIKPYDHAVVTGVVFLRTDSEDESIALHKYLTSQEGKDVVRKNKTSYANSKETFSYIPDPLK